MPAAMTGRGAMAWHYLEHSSVRWATWCNAGSSGIRSVHGASYFNAARERPRTASRPLSRAADRRGGALDPLWFIITSNHGILVNISFSFFAWWRLANRPSDLQTCLDAAQNAENESRTKPHHSKPTWPWGFAGPKLWSPPR